jgi:hypothetical protein
MDGHLLLPDGVHIGFLGTRGSLRNPPYARQDADDIDGYGPEIITIGRLLVGRYRYYVHRWFSEHNQALGVIRPRVELALPGRTPRLFVVPSLGDASDYGYWDVFAFDVDETCNITLIPTNAQVLAAPPSAPLTTGLACRRS